MSTPDLFFRACAAFCFRCTLAEHSTQYLARPEPATKYAPQTLQWRVPLGRRIASSNSGSSGRTPRRKCLQIRLEDMVCGQTQGSPSSRRRQFPLLLLQHWRVSLRMLRACPGVSRGSIFAGYFVFVTSLFIGFLLRDELGVCRVVQRDDRRFAKPLLLSID